MKELILKRWVLKLVTSKKNNDKCINYDDPNNDFYVTYIKFDSKNKFLVQGRREEGILGLFYDFDKSEYCIEGVVNEKDINISNIEVTHFYRGFSINYESCNQLAIRSLTYTDKFLYFCKRKYEDFCQSNYNRKALQFKPRHELLSFIITNYGLKNKEFTFFA